MQRVHVLPRSEIRMGSLEHKERNVLPIIEATILSQERQVNQPSPASPGFPSGACAMMASSSYTESRLISHQSQNSHCENVSQPHPFSSLISSREVYLLDKSVLMDTSGPYVCVLFLVFAIDTCLSSKAPAFLHQVRQCCVVVTRGLSSSAYQHCPY